MQRGVTDASASTIWRWLHEDAIKPRQTRSWIFPRDPAFAEKAGRVLDLYARTFEGKRLRPDEYVISADEKSQLQALGRRHPTVPAGPGRLPDSAADPPARARLVAEPTRALEDRALPLDRSTQSADPNDFPNLQALTDRLTMFAEHYRTIARPFDWTFTRNDLN